MSKTVAFTSAFLQPLEQKVRFRFKNHDWWDDFIPFRRMNELTLYVAGLQPSKLVDSLAQGADTACSRFGVRKGCNTHNAIAQTLDRAVERGDQLEPIWEDYYSHVSTAIRRSHVDAAVDTLQFVLKGQFTPGAVLSKLATGLLGDIKASREEVMNSQRFYQGIDQFLKCSVGDVFHLVARSFMREFEEY